MRHRRFLIPIVVAALALCASGLVSRSAKCCVASAAAARQEGPAPSSAIVVTDVSPYWTPTGSVVVIGFVTNVSDEPLTEIQVAASLIDRNRNDVATTEADLVPWVLLPGARAPWRVEIPSAPWQQGARARAQAIPVDPDAAARRTPSLQVDAVSVQANVAAGYSSRLVGRVVNAGTGVVTNVRVIGTLIAVDGRPAAAGESRLVVDELQPGRSEPFEIEFRPGALPKIVGYVVFPEGTVGP
jgi:hypothetical protein